MSTYQIAILLVLFILKNTDSRQIQVPPVTEQASINIKLHGIQPLNIPNYKFAQTYRKLIGEVKNKYISNFNGCQVKSPLVKFNLYQFFVMQYGMSKPYLIDDIKDIMYGQFVVDAFYKEKTLYLMLVNGKILVIGLDASLTKLLTQFQLDTNLGKISKGYFFENNGDVCFANANYVIVIALKGKTLSVIRYNDFLSTENLSDIQSFQSVVALDELYFAVAIKDRGIYINSRSTGAINQKLWIDKSKFRCSAMNLSIVDLQYDRNLYRLYVLDQQKGISIFTLDLTEQLDAELHPQMISVIGCQMIYLKGSQSLYASCRDLVKIQLQDDRIRIHSISESKLKIREIYENQDFLIVAGKSMFQLFYRGTLAEYVQDEFLDKLIIINDTWISINQYAIKLGKYQTLPQRIQCKMEEQSYIGTHRLQVKTLANCDKNYILAQNITFETDYTTQDMCWYTNYVDIKVWQSSDVALIPIAVAMIIFILSLWVIGLGWGIAKLKKNSVQKQLDEYQLIGQGNQGHIQLIEQEQGYSQKQNKNIEMQGKHVGQNDDKQLYAIE